LFLSFFNEAYNEAIKSDFCLRDKVISFRESDILPYWDWLIDNYSYLIDCSLYLIDCSLYLIDCSLYLIDCY